MGSKGIAQCDAISFVVAITIAHLARIGNVEDARCWWCNGLKQAVVRLLLECREWRREREAMVQKLKAKDIAIT